jgi:hypothetical protein
MLLILVQLCDFKSARGSKPIRPFSGTSHSLCREEFTRRHWACKTIGPAKQNEPCRKTPVGESAWLVCDLTPDTGATARCCHAAELPGTSRFLCRQQLRKVLGEPVTESLKSLNGRLLNNFLTAEEA